MKSLAPYAKAVVALVVSFIGSLVTLASTGVTVDYKTLLLALGTAIVTTYGVYATPNKEKLNGTNL